MAWTRVAACTGHRGPVYALETLTHDGDFLSGSGDGTVVRWNLAAPDEGQQVADVGQAVFSLHHCGEGILLVGTEGGGLHVIDLKARRERHLFEVHRRGLFRILSLSEGRFVCAGGDGTLSVWSNPADPVLLRHIPLVEEKLRDLCLSADGGALAVACGDGTVRVLDTTLFNEQLTLRAHPLTRGPGTTEGTIGATAVAFHPGKDVLLSGGKDGHLRAWRNDGPQRPVLDLPAHKGGLYRILPHPTSALIATASRDKSAKLWSPVDLSPIARLDRPAGGHTHSVNALLWIGDTLLTAGDDRTIIAWRNRTEA